MQSGAAALAEAGPEAGTRGAAWRQHARRLRRLIPQADARGAAPVNYTPALVLYVSAMATGATLAAALTVRGQMDPVGLSLLSVAVFCLSAWSVRSVVGDQGLFNASALVNLGLAITFGPVGALCGALAEALGALYLHRLGWFRSVFNVSTFFLANLTAWWLFHIVSSTGLPHVVALSLAGVAAGSMQFAVNQVAVAIVLSIAVGRSVRRTLLETWGVGLPSLFYGYGVVPFLVIHNAVGAVGLTWMFAPVIAMQVLVVLFARRVRAHEEVRDDLMDRLYEQTVRVERSYDATLIALTHALDARDKETEGHSRRVVEYTRCIAEALDMEGQELQATLHGALLHDIGKIGIPDAILHKPQQLTEEEWILMRMHPQIGAAMVEDIEVLRQAHTLILQHHERWDGNGYPVGLGGTRIILGARVFAVADTVDAITQDRPYRKAASMDEARHEIARYRGSQFDPEVVDAFLRLSEQQLLSVRGMRASAGIDMLSGHEVERARYLARQGLGLSQTPASEPAGAASR